MIKLVQDVKEIWKHYSFILRYQRIYAFSMLFYIGILWALYTSGFFKEYSV
jgi:hypothetical protein